MQGKALPWTISLGLHGALLLALLAALGPGHRHTSPRQETPLTRLVYVEPAPPPAPPLGDGGEARAPVAPPAPPSQPPVARPAQRPESPERAKDAPRPRPLARAVRRPPKPEHREPAAPRERASLPSTAPGERASMPPAAAPADDAVPGSGAPGSPAGAAGARGDVVGGTRDGTPGGVVGGLGTAPVTLREVASPPELLERVLPEYPKRARALEVEGQVVLEVVLDRSGRVEQELRVLRSVPLLDGSAIAAVRQWRFRPGRDRNGRPVRVLMEIPVRFVLR